jgi:5,10-methenyltetrahydromethanopterin hydrogenase
MKNLEKKFIDGIRYLKWKIGGLDEKIDLALIDMFKLKKSITMNYFKNHMAHLEEDIIVDDDIIIDDEEMIVTSDTSKKDLMKAFIKNRKSKLMNRILLNKFIEEIA